MAYAFNENKSKIDLKEITDEVNETINKIYSEATHLEIPDNFEQKGFDGTGIKFYDSKVRIAHTSTLSFNRDVTIKCDDGYKFGVHTWRGSTFLADSGWQTSYTVPKGTAFTIVLANNGNTTIKPTEYIHLQILDEENFIEDIFQKKK